MKFSNDLIFDDNFFFLLSLPCALQSKMVILFALFACAFAGAVYSPAYTYATAPYASYAYAPATYAPSTYYGNYGSYYGNYAPWGYNSYYGSPAYGYNYAPYAYAPYTAAYYKK